MYIKIGDYYNMACKCKTLYSSYQLYTFDTWGAVTELDLTQGLSAILGEASLFLEELAEVMASFSQLAS